MRHILSPAAGFTLIELMISITLFAILVLLAIPMYSEFTANAQIRNAAESLMNGARLAQSTAISLNTPARMVFITNVGYEVHGIDPINGNDMTLQVYQFQEGAKRAQIVPDPPGTATVTFNGLGRIAPNADASATMDQFVVTNPSFSTSRELHVLINRQGYGIKVCDPAIANTEPQHCPP